jgi:hypothetical protein
MLPLPKKHISECKKKIDQIFCIYISTSKRVCKVLPETDTFYGLCKNTKKIM